MTPTKATANRGNVAFRWRQAQGDYIRNLRERQGLTQADLVDKIGISSKQMISGIETARLNVPPDWVEDFADILGVDPAEFGKVLLRYQNPFLYAAIFGADAALTEELVQASSRMTGAEPRKRGPRK